MPMTRSDNPWRSAARAAAAAFLLNAALTFENLGPTPAVTWRGGLSVELAIVLIALGTIVRGCGAISRRFSAVLGGVWLVLTAARYAEVTAPALYGRDINLYWDLRFIPDVAAMITRVAATWMILAAVVAVGTTIWLLHRVFSWSFHELSVALSRQDLWRGMMAGSAVMLLLFGMQRAGAGVPLSLPSPVVHTYAHQLSLVARARRSTHTLPPTPSLESSFERLEETDVFVVFIESYGGVSFGPEVASRLALARTRLSGDIAGTGRGVVSALVESPTFGGSSWLAHLSFISAIEVRDPDTNALLMTQPRDTLVKSFGRHGFRTIALMPGLRQQWPEGRFYGFDEIYGAQQLGYTGPEFGWFAIPDQFSLAKFDALERKRPAGRRFVFFPTISTHFPFSPTPPYQPEWSRLFTSLPFDGPEIVRAYAHEPDWTNFVPGYIDALAYDFAVVGGYLRQRPEQKLLMVLIGDHQPAAAVSGEGASWNVPVHVIASDASILERLKERGFVDGLTPPASSLARMHLLAPMLLEAFGEHE
jgi:hypothetical protein